MHLGLILPNFGEAASPERIRRAAVAAEELGFDSGWATEHILVGAEAVDPYGRVFAPLVTLGWIAAFTERVALGTSIVLAPLHHPVHLAKEAATLQELSGGRLKLGLGMGWHEDEFRQTLGRAHPTVVRAHPPRFGLNAGFEPCWRGAEEVR